MKRMLVSAYCANFDGYDLLESILKATAFADMGVELSMYSKWSPTHPDFMEGLAKEQSRFAPYYTTFHGPYMELEASSPLDSDMHRHMIEAYAQALTFYKSFGAHGIVMHTNQKIQLSEDNRQKQSNTTETIREISAMAQKENALLYVENVGRPAMGNVLFPFEDFIALFDKIPESTKCLIDIGHAFTNRWDFDALISRLGSRIVAYHIHNNNGYDDSHRPLFEGDGFYNEEQWKHLFGLMERYTPNADWILEYAPGSHITPKLMADETKKILRIVD